MYYAYARMESLRNVIPQLFTSFNSPFPSRIRDPGMTVHDKRTWITNGITLRLLQDNKINTEYRYTKYNIIVYKHVHTHKRVPTRIVLLLLWRYYIIIINNMYDSQAVTFTRVSRIGGGGDAPEITNPNLSSKYLSQLYWNRSSSSLMNIFIIQSTYTVNV